MVYFTSVEGEYGIRVTNPRFIEENTEIKSLLENSKYTSILEGKIKYSTAHT